MNMQALVDAMNQAGAQQRANYHLTLGALVSELEKADASMPVIYDMTEPCSPSAPDSYRGYYDDLSFPPSSTPITVGELLRDAKDAIGRTFQGYKGGDFEMHEKTPLWASPYGISNGIAIIGSKVIGDRFVLITKQID